MTERADRVSASYVRREDRCTARAGGHSTPPRPGRPPSWDPITTTTPSAPTGEDAGRVGCFDPSAAVADRRRRRSRSSAPGAAAGDGQAIDEAAVVYGWVSRLVDEVGMAEALTVDVVTGFRARRVPRWLRHQDDMARLRVLTVQAVLDHRRAR